VEFKGEIFAPQKARIRFQRRWPHTPLGGGGCFKKDRRPLVKSERRLHWGASRGGSSRGSRRAFGEGLYPRRELPQRASGGRSACQKGWGELR
jgi:hypothetical protein